MSDLTDRVTQAVADIEAARDDIITERDKWRQYTQTLHDIVHGPASGNDSLVDTDSGQVKTAARVLDDLVTFVQGETLEALGAAPAVHSHDELDVDPI